MSYKKTASECGRIKDLMACDKEQNNCYRKYIPTSLVTA
jgi:hypothetical protein